MSSDSNPHDRQHQPPRIAITVGEAGGVGPELAIRCAAMPRVTQQCTPILVGPGKLVRRIAQHVGLPVPSEIVDVGQLDGHAVQPGHFSAASGRASFEAVEHAIQATLDGHFDAIVTGPIQKEAWHGAGIEFPGHTELFAQRTSTNDYAMMLTSDAISCVLATIHIPLADVAASLTIESVLSAIRHAADAASRMRSRPSRITVCGLNPHAGEQGLISHQEESIVIKPAVEAARRMGIDAVGPVSPDTAFTPAQRDLTGVYVCMYHDQGLIPLKALASMMPST